jgi:ABC-type transporter Mla subunit MlaD
MSVIARRRLVGLVVLVFLLGAVVVAWRAPDPFASTQTVRAELLDADGLAPIGADVRVAGVPVGTVSHLALHGSVAELTLTVDDSVGVIHRDATVALEPRMMFEGTAYVELTLGSPSAPPLRAGVIPTSQTSTYVPLEDTFEVLAKGTQPNIRTIAGAEAEALSGSAPRALHATLAAAPGLTADAAVVAAAARGHDDSLHGAVESFAHIAAAISSQAPALRSSLGDSASTMAALETSADHPLQASLGTLPVLTGDLRVGAGAAASILAQLQSLAPALIPGVEAMSPTLARVRPLLRRAAPALTSLTPVLGDAETALAGARTGAAPAGRAVAALEPTLDIYDRTLLSALAAPTDLGDPAYLAFLGLFEGGGGASRPFGVDGQGHFMRFGLRFLTGAGQPLPPCTTLAKLSPALAAVLATDGGCTS